MPISNVVSALEVINAWSDTNLSAMPQEFQDQWNPIQLRASPVDKTVYTAELMYGWLDQLPDQESRNLCVLLFEFAMSNGWFDLQSGRGQAIKDFVAGEAESGPDPLEHLKPSPPAIEPTPEPPVGN